MAHDQAPTVLVVEDDAVMQDLLHEILVDEGYRVLWAADGVRVFDLAAVARPAVILLDVRIPSTFGDDLLARLRQDRTTTHIPIIALTGRPLPAGGGRDEPACWIEKPFDVDVLLNHVGRLTARLGPTGAALIAADGVG